MNYPNISMRKALFIIYLSTISIFLNAQNITSKNIFISFGISVGKTFHAGLNYGYVIDFGLINPSNYNLKYGISYSHYLVRVKEMKHRNNSINAMIQNNFIDIKYGFGFMKNGWGYDNRNRCITSGYNFDINIKYPIDFSPSLGYKLFIYKKKGWAWFKYNYNSIYIGYKIIKPFNK